MLRFLYLIVRNIFIIPGIIKKMRQLTADEKTSEEERYAYLQYIVGLMQKTGHIKTLVYGEENLPEDLVKSTQDDIQKLTDKYVGIVDSLVTEKEKEVMTV